MEPPLAWAWLGRVRYLPAIEAQRVRRAAILEQRAREVLWLCEHPPVVSLGRAADASDLLEPPDSLAGRGIELHRVERGGRATYHGPGQLVGYPVVRLGGAGVGVARFVMRLGEGIAAWCRARGADARFDARCTGVFTPAGKIASMGIHVHRGVVVHGFALNLEARSVGDGFGAIVPCGLRDGRMTSLEAETGHALSPAAAAPHIALSVCTAIGRAAVAGAEDMAEMTQ